MIRGKLISVPPGGAVVRALSMVGFEPELPSGAPEGTKPGPIKYRLKAGYNGGTDPDAPHPASWSFGNRTPTCDCTGLVCWSLGFDRKQPAELFPHYGGYVNTDSAITDSRTTQSFFRPVSFPVVGDVVIYGGKFDRGKRVAVGHWGVVVAVSSDFDPENRKERSNWELVRIVDCSSSMSKKTGAAIHERPATVWRSRGEFLRYVRQAG